MTSTLSAVSTGLWNNDANDGFTAGDTYHADGNTVSSGGIAAVYDFENHLIQKAGVTIVYDGNGNRVSKTVAGVTTTYLVDTLNPTGYAQVVFETFSGGSSGNYELNHSYVYGLELISQTRSCVANFQSATQKIYYAYDGHGSVRALTDPTGADTYDYDAFGNLIHSSTTLASPTPNNYLFAGEQFDSDLGLYYNRARYLNTPTGRFWNMDAYEGDALAPISLHKYLYASENPVNIKDRSGRDGVVDFLVAAAVFTTIEAFSAPTTGTDSTFSGAAFTVLTGPFLGGYDVNDYLKGNYGWVPFAAPGVAGEEVLPQGGAYFKVQIAAPFRGPQNVFVRQTITPIDANGPLLSSISDYLARYQQPPAGNGQTVGEPALASGSGGWVPLYTASDVTFADAPGGFAQGSAGDLQFQTTFYTIIPSHSRAVVWTLHVDFSDAHNQQLSVTQGAQTAQ